MEEEKFSQGPWKAHSVGERYMKGNEIFEIHWSDDGECVAEIVHGADDAYLIAAAPDLYSALKEACLQHISINGTKPPVEWINALKKARGEA